MAGPTVSEIASTARIILQDAGVRWTDSEMITWVTDGRRVMAELKPSVFGQGSQFTHTLTAGCFQTLGVSGAYALSSIDSNVGGKVIRPADKNQLDAYRPSWRNDTATVVDNWFPDTVNPLGFWVYPAAAGKQIIGHMFVTPVPVTGMNDEALPFAQYTPILVNYVLYRAFSKEDEAGSVAKAQAAYTLFTTALAPA